jgi:hypothetical protein
LIFSVPMWRRYNALPAHERKIAREAARRLTLTWLGLRTLGFKRIRENAERFPRSTRAITDTSDANPQLIASRMIARLIGSASRHLFFTPNCLVQSLALLEMLRLRGIPAELRVGARHESGAFEAHAWVEFAGIVLNDVPGEHHHFTPFESASVTSASAPESHAPAGTRVQ